MSATVELSFPSTLGKARIAEEKGWSSSRAEEMRVARRVHGKRKKEHRGCAVSAEETHKKDETPRGASNEKELGVGGQMPQECARAMWHTPCLKTIGTTSVP